MMHESDYEALCGIEMFWAGHPAFKTFVALDPQKIYDASRRLISSSAAQTRCDQLACQIGVPLGDYSIACWSGNVGDVFRSIKNGTIPEPTTVDEWAKAILQEYEANVKAAGL